ncbi:hypothetical protein ACA910_019301 [Epithemia clementina (nom. ined.)]
MMLSFLPLSFALLAFALVSTFVTAQDTGYPMSQYPSVSPTYSYMPSPKEDGDMQIWKTIQIGLSDTITQLNGLTDGLGDVYTWDRRNQIYLADSLEEFALERPKVLGDNEGYCIRIMLDESAEANHLWTCTIIVYLEGGALTAVGPFQNNATTVPIVGGTGIYLGATGYLELAYAGLFEGFPSFHYDFYLNEM